MLRHLAFCAFVIAAGLVAAGPGAAEEWNLRDADIPLTPSQVSTLTAGRTLTFHDDGQSKFSVGGAYSYTYGNDGGTAFGRFTVKKDGRVCIDFTNGRQRCDLYVKSGGLLMMITQRGDRFPVRLHIELKP